MVDKGGRTASCGHRLAVDENRTVGEISCGAGKSGDVDYIYLRSWKKKIVIQGEKNESMADQRG